MDNNNLMLLYIIHVQIPDELTRHVLTSSGCCIEPTTSRSGSATTQSSSSLVVRLVSVAGEMFLNSLLDDALVIQQNRMQAPQKYQQSEGYPVTGRGEKKSVLVTEDIAGALSEYGMALYRPRVCVQQQQQQQHHRSS